MKKNIIAVSLAMVLFVAGAGIASAHVVVKPAEVSVGAFTDFTVGVPVERDVPTIGIKIVIPEGLDFVTPLLKPGWKIDVKRGAPVNATADDGDAVTAGPVTEISWTGNEIPAGFKDAFTFSAKAPIKVGSVQWKAYQTYKDGAVVSWDVSADAQPKGADGKPDFSKSGPYSETKVVDDLAASTSNGEESKNDSKSETLTLALSVIAIIMAGYSLYKK
jgi:uncharacterized protein YcnI